LRSHSGNESEVYYSSVAYVKPTRQFRTKLTGIILGLLATLVASLGFYRGFYDRFERLSLDFRFRNFHRDTRDSDQVCVIGIDDASLSSIGDWPWPRTHLAKMINLLNELESREILIDLVFSMPKSDQSVVGESADSAEEGTTEDDILAQACREQGQVVLSAYFADEPMRSAVFDQLVRDFRLSPDDICRKTGLSFNQVRSNFSTMRRLAARKLVAEQLLDRPKLTRDEVAKKILGKGWIVLGEHRRVIEQAYDYVQAYLQVRGKAGWGIDNLRLPIRVFRDETQMVIPVAKLADSCADVGIVNFDRDPDGKVREISLLDYYDGVIYRQLALAGICQHLEIEPDNVRIGGRSIELLGEKVEDSTKAVILGSDEPSGIQIPLTRQGRMIINWYAPQLDRWDKSFRNIIPAGRVLEIALSQEALSKNRRLLAEALGLAVKHFLPGRYEQYQKLPRQLPLLHDSVSNVLHDIGDEKAVTTAPATQPVANHPSEINLEAMASSQPTTSTSPATTVEQDLIQTYRSTKAEIEKIEAEAREQLEWLYQQLSELTAEEQLKPENRLVRDLWRCVNHPEEIRRINAELESDIDLKIKKLTPLVRGKVVLIGYTATTLADFVSTPVFDQCPGVLVHANIVNQILQKSFFSESDRNSDLLVILVVGTLVSILSAQRSAFEGLLWLLLIVAGVFGFTCYVAFERLQIVSSLVGPMVAAILSWSLVSFYRQLTEGRAKRVFAGRLSQYTNPALAKRIAEDPDALEIVPEQREVTCYFSDIAGFTSLSEKLGPEKTVGFLNIYLEHMSEMLDAQEAFINKFQGDGIFAFFNPPLHNQDDHARRACLAAIESQIQMPHIQEHLEERFPLLMKQKLQMRVGISTGPAVVGDCGSKRKFDYTCLGDTVNLAARLESVNKVFGTQIMICRQTQQMMGDDLLARLLGKIRVMGRAQPVVVYELIGYKDDHKDDTGWVKLFGDMVLGYWDGHFDNVRSMLKELEAMRPGDKSVKIYRELLDKVAKAGKDAFHDGVIEMETK